MSRGPHALQGWAAGHSCTHLAAHSVDASGVAPFENGFLVSSGIGKLYSIDDEGINLVKSHHISFDNHLISLV